MMGSIKERIIELINIVEYNFLKQQNAFSKDTFHVFVTSCLCQHFI